MASKFSVIKGGNNTKFSINDKYFISAYVTDTRLMGVLALSINWEINTLNGPTNFNQFFYFDAEEYGFETYKGMTGEDEETITAIELGIIGGLGGEKVPVSEKEARFLVQYFVKEGKKLNAPLPEPKSEYSFLLEDNIKLTGNERQELIDKICTPILSDYHLIHYFLMRCIGKDYIGASYLTYGEIDIESVSDSRPATLCKNSIEEFTDDNGRHSYLCEALIEINEKYKILVLEITTAKTKITSVYRRSSFRVSSAEAAMLLNRPEFVTVYEILTDPENFDEKFLPLTSTCMNTAHDNGRLYLEFNASNDHVNRKIFMLNEDVYGLYYVSDFGQLILAAYGISEIRSLEKTLTKSPLHPYLLPVAKYEFKEPILYEFIQSDFEDFNEFLESIK